MKKRILALCLIIAMLLTSVEGFSNVSFATTEIKYPGYSTLTSADKTAIDLLEASNVPLKNSLNMYLCIKIYTKYNQVVYDVKGKYLTSTGFGDQDDTSGEYRFLGYDLNGKEVTNDNKFNDSGPVTATSLLSKNWKIFDSLNLTWQDMLIDTEEALLGKPFISQDGTNQTNTDKYNVSHVLQGKTGFLYSPTLIKAKKDQLKSYIQVLVLPSIANDGSLQIVHRKGKVNWYNTLRVENVNKASVPTITLSTYSDPSCTQPKSQFDIEAGKNSVDVYVKVNTDVKFKDALLTDKEAEFITSVINTLAANGNHTGATLTNFTNPTQMANVFKLTYKRENLSNIYKDMPMTAKAVIKPKTSILDITTEVSTTGNFQVRALNPSDLVPNFQIWHLGLDKTDGAVNHDKTTIDKDFDFDLKDQTIIPKDNQIVNYNWFAFNETKQAFDYVAWVKDPTFKLKVADVPAYVKDGAIRFKEVVTDRSGKVYTSQEHTIQILTVPDGAVTPPATPKAWVYPPRGVYAGERTFITGEATITGGTITDYEFGLAANFMTTASKLKERQGTFLSYDTNETTTLTVTSNNGSTDMDQGETTVYHPIRPVMKTNGVYKINRTIELDSTDSLGTEFYPIDKVTWTIRPMDNQSLGNIKTHDSSITVGNAKQVVGAKPKVDFKQLGRYEVLMDVHSTCTYTGETHRTATKQVMGIITIQPDQPPVAKLSVPSAVIRNIDTYKMAIFDIQDLSYSTDGDTIGRRTYSYRYDTNNDKSLADETWTVLDDGNNIKLQFKTPLVGLYEFKIAVEEGNDSQGSPYWTVGDILKDNTDTQPLAEKMTEVVNVAPITAIFADRKKVDVVFATDYEGADLSQLKSDIDMLTKELYEQGIDIRVSFINDKIYSGTFKDALYTFARLARVSYYKDYQNLRNYADQFHGWVTDVFNWDTKYQSDKDYLPNYGSIPVGTTTRTYDISSGGNINRGIYVDMSVPTDPVKKNHTQGLTTDFSDNYNGWSTTYKNISSSVDGFFTNLGINSYVNRDLFCIDLAKVKAYTYRPLADKKLYFLTKSANSLLKLDEPFKQWVKQNDIEVSAVSGGDLKDKLGGNKFKNILLEGDATYYQAENNDQYKLGGTNGSLPEAFLSSIPQGTKGFSGMGLEIHGQTSVGWSLPPSALVSDNWLSVSNSKTGEAYYYACQNGNLVKLNSSYAVVKNFGTLYSALKLREERSFIYNTASGTFYVASNFFIEDGFEETTYRPSYEQDPSTRYFHNEVASYVEVQLPGSVDGNSVTTFKMRKIQLNSWDVVEYVESSVFRCSNGSAYYVNRKEGDESLYKFKPEPSYPNASWGTTTYGTRNNFTKTLVALPENYTVLVGLNSNRLLGLTNTGLLRTASLTQETNNVTAFDWTAGTTMPTAYPKAILKPSGNDMEGLILKTDGTVSAFGPSNNNRFGYNRYMNWENPIIEARSVTNEAPVSLGELLSLNTKSKAYATYADLRASLRSEYVSLPYTAQMTVIVDDTLDCQVLYSDFEGDPKFEDAIAITHNPNALENPIGTDANNGKTVANWNGKLSKTGLYTLKPKVRDNPNEDNRFDDYRLWNKDDMTMNVLVHRKPLPRPRYTQSNHADPSKIYLNAQDGWSYDLDRFSSANRGIALVEWGFKAVNDDLWQVSTGALGTTLQKEMIRGTRYMMSYRVKDVDGAWSLPVVEEVTAGANLLFDATMRAKDQNQDLEKFPKGSTVTFANVWSSYELNHHLEIQLFDGTTPVTGKTLIAQNASTVASAAVPEVYWNNIDYSLPNTLLEKTYKVRISAVDDVSPNIVKYKEFPVTIVNNSPPTIQFTKVLPMSFYEGDLASVQLVATDPDKDILDVAVYICYEGKTEVLLEKYKSVVSGTTLQLNPFEIKNAKSVKLRAVATDPQLLTGSAELEKPIQILGIESITTKGAWNHWRGQKNAFGEQMSNEPWRFLSYEKMSVTVETRGLPDKITLNLEAPLEAMTYTDTKGRAYAYKDELGYEVLFPIIFKKTNVNNYKIEYILPFANSTIDWKNQRKRPPYQLYVTLIKDGRSRTIVIGDDPGEPKIDVTGNIFDLIYNQPAKPAHHLILRRTFKR